MGLPARVFVGVFVMAAECVVAASPDAVDGIVVVGGVGRERIFGKAVARGRVTKLVAVPVRDSEAGDAEVVEMRAHIVRHPAEILGDDFRAIGGIENRTQPHIAIAAVGGFVFDRVVGSQKPAGQHAVVFFGCIVVAEPDEFVIAFGSPRKGIDAVKSEDVVESEDAENFGEAANAIFPPCKTIRLHVIPTIERDAPVLSPFLRAVNRRTIRGGNRRD